MTVLRGDTESRTVYQNFALNNLNINNPDYTHYVYQKYLQLQQFIPPNETKYFAHMINNHVPGTQASNTTGKGLFNLFPLDLSHSLKQHGGGSSVNNTTLGIVSTSPLKLELEFSPVPANTWFVTYTFVYLNKIEFPGQKLKQEVVYDYVNSK